MPTNEQKLTGKGFSPCQLPMAVELYCFSRLPFQNPCRKLTQGLTPALDAQHGNGRNLHFNQVTCLHRYPSFTDKIMGQHRLTCLVAESQTRNILGSLPPIASPQLLTPILPCYLSFPVNPINTNSCPVFGVGSLLYPTIPGL